MNTLDDLNEIKKLDPSNVLGSIGLFPDQCNQAFEEASKIAFPPEYKTVKNIVVAGMGGSRFTPRTIKELYQTQISVPYEIVDSYTLPGYVNEETLVILSSYSGTTEEVLECGKMAREKKAKITGLAYGGPVIEFLKTNAYPYYQFEPKNNPCGQPRVGGGYLLMGHLAFLNSLGFLSVPNADVKKAIEWARTIGQKYVPTLSCKDNPAKELAVLLKDKHTFFVASEFLRGYVNGFANQMNETAKIISDFRYIPELNHHMMEGLKHPDLLKQNGLFVFITSPLYSPKILKRFDITKEVVEKQGIATTTISLTGTDPLSATLEGFALAGYTTFYLAMLYDTDPVAIPWVDYFKAQLAK